MMLQSCDAVPIAKHRVMFVNINFAGVIMINHSQLALSLARRQKRLNFWKQAFLQESLTESTKNLALSSLSTFVSLMSKLAKASSADEQAEIENQLLDLERQLNELYDQSRLATSSINAGGANQIPSRV
jgi:hypothetical protein